MGNTNFSYVNIFKEPKVDGYNTIFTVSFIISASSFIVYLPILFLFLKTPFTRIKVAQLELIISSILQNITLFYKGGNTQEYLCITKGPLNLILYFSTILSSTVIVYIAFQNIWNPNDKKITCCFISSVTFFSLGIPFLFFIISIIMSDYIEIDYNHPCWIHNVYIIGVFFVLCYLSLGINLVYIIISIIRMNKYINQYKEDKIGLLFRRRLTKFLIWTIFCILVFIHKFSMFFYEFHNNVMRNFYEILLKSVIESTNGPLYVIIYCYTHKTFSQIKELLCKKKVKDNNRGISLIPQNHSTEDTIFDSFGNDDDKNETNSTIY